MNKQIWNKWVVRLSFDFSYKIKKPVYIYRNLRFKFFDSEITFTWKDAFFWKQFEYNWKTILKTIEIYHDLLKLSNIANTFVKSMVFDVIIYRNLSQKADSSPVSRTNRKPLWKQRFSSFLEAKKRGLNLILNVIGIFFGLSKFSHIDKYVW